MCIKEDKTLWTHMKLAMLKQTASYLVRFFSFQSSAFAFARIAKPQFLAVLARNEDRFAIVQVLLNFLKIDILILYDHYVFTFSVIQK